MTYLGTGYLRPYSERDPAMQIGDLEKRAKEKGKAAFAGVIVEYVQEQFRYWIEKGCRES